jgi:hypothetical protein
MKTLKWIPLVLLLPALFLLTGCPNPEEEGTVPNVTGLTIIVDSEGDGIIISWNEVTDVDGYDLYTPDGDTILLDYDETSYNDDAPSMTGDYEVVTVSGDDYSSGVTASTAPYVSSSNATIYVWSNPTDPSGFGWSTTTGIGTVYNCVDANKGVVDFYLNNSSMPFDFTSADEVPYEGDKVSHILNMGNSDFSLAPASGYYNTESVVSGNYYAINVQGDYYAKVYVVSATADVEATFSYEFQTIQSFRLF